MFNGLNVVAVVPAGRRRYLSILLPYLRRQKGMLDRCDLWCNTADAEDVVFIRQAAAEDPFFRVVEAAVPIDGSASVYHFFRHCVDPDTVYVRFDDDVCWVAPDAIERLVRFRLDHPHYSLVFANTVNNVLCSHLHQRLGCIPLDEGFCGYDAYGRGWWSPEFAALTHEAFLSKMGAGRLAGYTFPQWIAWENERISTHCICWTGRDFAEFGGQVDPEDEYWLTQVRPAQTQRPIAICGTALVSHFAYGTQRVWLEENTELLARYQHLADALDDQHLADALNEFS